MFIKKALVATDFSLPSMHLVDSLAELISFGLEEILLVHVVDIRAPGGSAVSLQSIDEEVLDRKKKSLEELGLKVQVIVPIGFPAPEIVKIATEHEASLIAITSHGKGIIKQLFLGSTTTDVIRSSTVPVLISKYREQQDYVRGVKAFQKLLVPLDFSPYSEKLLDQLEELTGLVKEVIMLSVIERADSDEQLLQIIDEREGKLLEEKIKLEKLGLKVQTMILQGTASVNIIETADQEGVTMIMMATRGEGLLQELILGSTAHAVARRSKQPLLLIPLPRD